MNLRTRFGLPKAEVTGQTRIVVAKSGEDWVGLIVDGVSEVLRIPAEAVEPTPAMATTAAFVFPARDRQVRRAPDHLVGLRVRVGISVAGLRARVA